MGKLAKFQIFFLLLASSVPVWAVQASGPSPELPALLDEYLALSASQSQGGIPSDEDERELLQGGLRAHIRRVVFQEPSEKEGGNRCQPFDPIRYEADLRLMDQLAVKKTGEDLQQRKALYELAHFLQMSWERNPDWGLAVRAWQDRQNRMGTVGATMGGVMLADLALAVGAIASVRNPLKTPKYFRLYRAFAVPVSFTAGAIAGAKGLSYMTREMTRPDVPPAPATFLRLGVTQVDDVQKMNEEELINMITAISSGLVAGIGALKLLEGVIVAARVFRRVTTPLKFTPVTLVCFALVEIFFSVVVEDWVYNWLENKTYEKMKGPFVSKYKALARISRAAKDVKLLRDGEKFLDQTLQLGAYIFRPYATLQMEFIRKLSELKEHVGGDEKSPLYLEQSERLATDFLLNLQSTVMASSPIQDTPLDGFEVRDSLRGDWDAWKDLSGSNGVRAEFYVKGFKGWKSETHEPLAYLNALDARADEILVQEVLDGKVKKQSSHVLLQGAALLRQTGVDYLAYHADLLMKVAKSNHALIRQVLDWDGTAVMTTH